MILLNEIYKTYLKCLTEFPPSVFMELCKIATDSLVNGPNMKLYSSAAGKLNVDSHNFQKMVESISNFLVECCKQKAPVVKVKDYLSELSFNDEHANTLARIYSSRSNEISHALIAGSVKLPIFKNLEWRIDGEIGSRALPEELRTSVLLKLSLENTGENGGDGVVMLETDPANLTHVADVLEEALSQWTDTRHSRRVQRRFTNQ